MVGSRGIAGHAGHEYRGGQAAACRDRQALAKEVELLILDEPTAALNEDDSENLLRLAGRTEAAGDLVDPDLPQAERNRCR